MLKKMENKLLNCFHTVFKVAVLHHGSIDVGAVCFVPDHGTHAGLGLHAGIFSHEFCKYKWYQYPPSNVRKMGVTTDSSYG